MRLVVLACGIAFLLAGTAGVMNDPTWQVTAYRMVLELPAE